MSDRTVNIEVDPQPGVEALAGYRRAQTLTPFNEAGITATFAAIFARLDELEDVAAAQALRFANHERLESARIAAPTAPESAVTASGVPQEPGNATERYGGDPIDFYDPQLWTAIAAHIHRPFGGYPYDTANADHCTLMAEIVCEAIAFIQRDEDNAWLKEGEA